MENQIQEIVSRFDPIDSKFINSQIKKVLKKMSVKSSADLINLKNVLYGLYCKGYKQEFYSLCPVLIEFEYKNWDTWTWCEYMLALLYFDAKINGDPLHFEDVVLNKILAQKDMVNIKRTCDGGFLVDRKSRLDKAKELGKKTDIRDCLLLYLYELVLVYACGGSEMYPLEFLEKEIFGTIDELNTIL